MKISTLRENGNDYMQIWASFRPKPLRVKIFSLHTIGLKPFHATVPFKL
jgi:hypothetical protein